MSFSVATSELRAKTPASFADTVEHRGRSQDYLHVLLQLVAFSFIATTAAGSGRLPWLWRLLSKSHEGCGKVSFR